MSVCPQHKRSHQHPPPQSQADCGCTSWLLLLQEQYQTGGGADTAEDKMHTIKFGQIYLSKPTMVEGDGETAVLFPKEARLRNLT